jgi:hypothetical protein
MNPGRMSIAIASLIAIAVALGGCGASAGAASSSPDAAHAIDVATRAVTDASGFAPTFVGARRGPTNCSPLPGDGPCPVVWWVTFRATTNEGQPATAVAVVDATSFAYMYTDWSPLP